MTTLRLQSGISDISHCINDISGNITIKIYKIEQHKSNGLNIEYCTK